MRLPNCLLAGFEKCGTTSIYNYLNQHPHIYMSPVKEPNFLERDWDTFTGEKKDRIDTLEKYQNLFSAANDSHIAIGEASPNLLFYYQSSIPRIQHYVPDAKIVAILRDPVERAYSDYLMHIRDEIKGNDRSLVDQVKYSPQTSHTLKKGLYYAPIQHFMAAFGPEQFQVCWYEDFAQDPIPFMQKLYQYFGVDPSFVPDVSHKAQMSQIPRSRSINKLLRTSNPLRNTIAAGLRLILPLNLRQRIRTLLLNLNSQGKATQSLSDEERSALSRYYYEDILQLQNLLQQDLSHWTPLKRSSELEQEASQP